MYRLISPALLASKQALALNLPSYYLYARTIVIEAVFLHVLFPKLVWEMQKKKRLHP